MRWVKSDQYQLDYSQHTIERHLVLLREERLQAKSGWTPLGARSRGRDRPTENIRQGEETATHSPAGTTHTNRKHWNVLVKRGLVGNSAEKRLVDLRNARIYTVVSKSAIGGGSGGSRGSGGGSGSGSGGGLGCGGSGSGGGRW